MRHHIFCLNQIFNSLEFNQKLRISNLFPATMLEASVSKGTMATRMATTVMTAMMARRTIQMASLNMGITQRRISPRWRPPHTQEGATSSHTSRSWMRKAVLMLLGLCSPAAMLLCRRAWWLIICHGDGHQVIYTGCPDRHTSYCRCCSSFVRASQEWIILLYDA